MEGAKGTVHIQRVKISIYAHTLEVNIHHLAGIRTYAEGFWGGKGVW